MQDTPVVEQLPSILDHIQKEAIRCKCEYSLISVSIICILYVLYNLSLFHLNYFTDNRITTKTPLEISQKSLEGTYLVIRTLQRRIDQEAGNLIWFKKLSQLIDCSSNFSDILVSSKERIELRFQVRKQKEKAAKLIGIINDQLKCEDPKVTMEDCFKGVFPWQPAYQSKIFHLITYPISKFYILYSII